MSSARKIAPEDIMPMAEYGRIRAERRRALVARKKNRRVEVGPCATFYFENRDTMWMQIHEMLYIEKGGPEQIPGELEAYNPLIPDGSELIATLMFEIEDQARRRRLLAGLGGVENQIRFSFARQTVASRPEMDLERTTEDGKASSVHFLHFHFTPAQVALFKEPGLRVMLEMEHPAYGHAALLPEAVRAELAGDFA